MILLCLFTGVRWPYFKHKADQILHNKRRVHREQQVREAEFVYLSRKVPCLTVDADTRATNNNNLRST